MIESQRSQRKTRDYKSPNKQGSPGRISSSGLKGWGQSVREALEELSVGRAAHKPQTGATKISRERCSINKQIISSPSFPAALSHWHTKGKAESQESPSSESRDSKNTGRRENAREEVKGRSYWRPWPIPLEHLLSLEKRKLVGPM